LNLDRSVFEDAPYRVYAVAELVILTANALVFIRAVYPGGMF
jgi:hypothetical protein